LDCIVVQEQQKLTTGFRCSTIAAAGIAVVFAASDQIDMGMIFRYPIGTPISGSIVHHDNFEIGIGGFFKGI
jgi:hypothetical protein